MMHKNILIASLLLSLATPAYAYVTPEQMLEQNQYQLYYPDPEEGPYEPEEAEEEPAVSGVNFARPKPKYRIQESQGPPTRLKKYQAAPEEPVIEKEPLIDESVGEDLPKEKGVTVTLDARAMRILDRLTKPKTLVSGQSIPAHTGAPLAPTGPATVITMGGMLLAIFGTMKRVRMLERR